MYVSISVYICVGTSEFPSSSPDASWWFFYFFSAKWTSNEDSDYGDVDYSQSLRKPLYSLLYYGDKIKTKMQSYFED